MAELVDTVQDLAVESQQEVSGLGLDVGTGYIVSAKEIHDKVSCISIRDSFYKIPLSKFNASLFNTNDMKYVRKGDDVFIIGENANSLARMYNDKCSRPLASGIINPKERKSAFILKEMFRHVVEKFVKKDERLVFSIPGPMVNDNTFNVDYHSMSLTSLIETFGCDPKPLNEAYAVLLSELQTSNLTGLGISFGAGLINCCFAYKGISLFEFCINKSGDFIDEYASEAIGESLANMTYIKENQLDLATDIIEASREEQALIYAHKAVITNCINQVKTAFNNGSVNVVEAIPIVISGGTSIPNGFIDLFRNDFKKSDMPFKVSDFIRASDPLKAVAKGCLVAAQMGL